MNCKMWLTAAAISVMTASTGQMAWSQPTSGVKAGALTCNVQGGWGLVFGSSRDLRCTFTDNNRKVERYTGRIGKFGVDLGYQAGGVLVWAVLSPTADIGKGALAGSYGGVTGGAALGVGGTANVLVGGSQNTISLQPLSIEGTTGINVAAGIAQLVLKAQ